MKISSASILLKKHENFLIILRNGKLYSIDIGSEAGNFLKAVDNIDAFHPGWTHDVWLDEMLINDGLISKIEDRYQFRSGLVRRYWKEYEAE